MIKTSTIKINLKGNESDLIQAQVLEMADEVENTKEKVEIEIMIEKKVINELKLE